ncbi:hypothetical protein Tco_1321973 [Tanacetum coccineum]
MSSDNASSAINYTSVSSDSNGPSSWGIPLVNVGELPEMDPYEEVTQQGQAHPLSPAYVPDPMELDEHVPVYVPEPEHPKYHVPSYDDIQVEDQPYADDDSPTAESPGYIADSDSMKEDTDEDSIDYPDEPEDGKDDDDVDFEEDPSEEHKPEDDVEDLEKDPNEEHEPENEDTKEEESCEGFDETELFEEDETAITPSPPRHRGVRISIRPQTPTTASTQALIDAFAAGSPPFLLPPTIPAYDQAPLGYRAAMIHMSNDIPEEDMPHRRRFVLTAPPLGCDVAESSTAAAKASRAADRAEDVGYVRALQASEHRMMTSIEEVNLRVSYQAQVRRRESRDFYTQILDAQTDRRDIRLEIDVMIGQGTAYEKELREVRQAYLSSEARNRALLARLETLETHMSRMEWQRQSAEDRAVRHMMRTHNHVCNKTRNSTHTQDDASHNLGGGLRRPVQLVRVCSYPDFMKSKTEGMNLKALWAWSAPTRLYEMANPLNSRNEGIVDVSMDSKSAALTWWNGHMRTLGHDAAYAMTWGTFKKKLTDKYCPNGEIKKLEIELWNLKVKGNDVWQRTHQWFQN